MATVEFKSNSPFISYEVMSYAQHQTKMANKAIGERDEAIAEKSAIETELEEALETIATLEAEKEELEEEKTAWEEKEESLNDILSIVVSKNKRISELEAKEAKRQRSE